MIEGVIFDVDGTLLDSMGTWHDCGARYLARLGVEAEPGLGDYLFTQTNETGAYYLVDHYGLDKSPEEVAKGLSEEMERFYFEEAQPKEGAVEFLDRLSEDGVPVTVATSTDRYLIDRAFSRLGITDRFKAVLSCPDFDTTKKEPLIFFEAAKVMGSRPEATWVFEDGLYAIRTAKEAGFRTAAVYDSISGSDWNEMKELADIHIDRFDEIKERFECYAG